MKYVRIIYCVIVLNALLALSACHEAEQADGYPITFDLQCATSSRVSANAFEEQDKVGVYMTKKDVPLELAGNFLNNELLIFDGIKWNPTRKLYWDDGMYDVYAYYPFVSSPTSVDDLPFSVALDQTTLASTSELGGYEASDFLWASNEDLSATASPVTLLFKHRMSKVVVRLVKGEDYDGEVPEDAEVYIHNTIPSATIDLEAGYVTRDIYGRAQTIKAKKVKTGQYTAIIVPQRMEHILPLFEVVMAGVSYMVEDRFVFKTGVQHLVSVTLAKNPEQVKIEIGGEIENWED